MGWNTMFNTTVCVIFLIKLRWPKNKSLYDKEKETHKLHNRLKKSKPLNRISPESGKRMKVDMQRLSPREICMETPCWSRCGLTPT